MGLFVFFGVPLHLSLTILQFKFYLLNISMFLLHKILYVRYTGGNVVSGNRTVMQM